jgi:L-seryl-tRNA(Ser) seleniumtransferase
MSEKKEKLQTSLRQLPSVDMLLKTEAARKIEVEVGQSHLTRLARATIEALRVEMLSTQNSHVEVSRAGLLLNAENKLSFLYRQENRSCLARVINASGVIVHTNLGRAPLSQSARKAIKEEASRYCSLECDLSTGKRGRRGAQVEELLKELTGAEEALVVNNCAAAALLTLTVLARQGEVIVSRGELVEIGGDFRVPDVMVQSGARLAEVGTTNRTKLADYDRAITENTSLIMRVHPSNYRVIGFTASPSLEELVQLAHSKGLPLYEDAGSGALVDLKPCGLDGEPLIGESIATGADVVTFSGDKLLGSVQAGLIVGKREIVERLRRHPLYRALRVDKLAYAALEATLKVYRRGAAFDEIPVLRMLARTFDELRERADSFITRFLRECSNNESLTLEIVEGESAIGGGSAPTTHPKTALIALEHKTLTANALEEALRANTPPVIARIVDDRVLLDLRTVFEDEEEALMRALRLV